MACVYCSTIGIKFKNMIIISSIILCILHNTQMTRHSKTGKKPKLKNIFNLEGSFFPDLTVETWLIFPMVIPLASPRFRIGERGSPSGNISMGGWSNFQLDVSFGTDRWPYVFDRCGASLHVSARPACWPANDVAGLRPIFCGSGPSWQLRDSSVSGIGSSFNQIKNAEVCSDLQYYFWTRKLWSFFWSLALILGETKVQLGTNHKAGKDNDVFLGPRMVKSGNTV